MKNKLFLIALSGWIICILSSCSGTYQYPFQNPELSLEERVEDLVGRMTLEEKVSQMQNHCVAIERLGIPQYNWWNECLHGVGRSGHQVTVFPQAIALAATFNKEAMLKMGMITSTEARAIYNESFKNGRYGEQYQGLTFWTPNINIFRDPRWGRGQETYGEDPYLTSVMGKEMVRGLQGEDSLYLKVSACAKHFAVHSGPEEGRHSFDISVSDYDLWDTYLPAFESLVKDANVSSVMCAYNRFEGEPCCGNSRLMIDILRNQWNFKGYVTSDCGAIDDFYNHHKTHPDAASASASAVLNGTDLDCGNQSYATLVDAVKKGLISEKDIDVSVKRLFLIRFRLGMFDSFGSHLNDKIKYDTLECAQHKAHALQTARESIVLLKNKNNILPLSGDTKKIVVLGPNADDEEVQLGNYNGFPSEIITPLKGMIAQSKTEVKYAKATGHVFSEKEEIETALKTVEGADIVLFVGGITPRLEGENGDAGTGEIPGFEGGDRTSIVLPGVQTDFIKKLKEKNIPIVFVCMSGSAIAYNGAEEDADAVLQIWYGGQSVGTALADIIFGNYNPGGRLPVTFYKSDKDLPDYYDYSMKNRTYRYFGGEPLYPFGYGLSYTSFVYDWINQPKRDYPETGEIECSVKIRNAGEISGDEVPQVYVAYPDGSEGPRKELKYFERISVIPGQDVSIQVSFPVQALAKWSEKEGKLSVPKGAYQIWVGSNAEDRRLAASFTVR